MKARLSLLCSLVVVLLCLSGIIFAGNVPSPFDKIKELARSGKVDDNGNLLREFKKLENGINITYIMLYEEGEGGVITVGKLSPRESVVVHYLEVSGRCVARLFIGNLEVDRQDITLDQAQEFGYKIFKILVGGQDI